MTQKCLQVIVDEMGAPPQPPPPTISPEAGKYPPRVHFYSLPAHGHCPKWPAGLLRAFLNSVRRVSAGVCARKLCTGWSEEGGLGT